LKGLELSTEATPLKLGLFAGGGVFDLFSYHPVSYGEGNEGKSLRGK
jgi:hypothetical protein